MKKHHYPRLHTAHRHITAYGSFLLMAACMVFTLVNSGALPGTTGHGRAATCSVSAKLVNSCRPWIGAAVGGYGMVGSDATSQFNFANKRLNDPSALNNPNLTTAGTSQLDIIHTYKTNTNTSFSSVENTFMAKPNTYLLINYKPDTTGWASAGGGNASINARIDALADSFKSKSQYTFFLAVFHEPENDVSSGNCTANANGASAGSPTDYVNMWHNVRSRFDAKGVNNVVWVMNYMGYSGWNCLVPLLWPGNSYVDWIMYDPYSNGTGGNASFSSSVGEFYDYLTSNSNATHDYLSKTWGLAEHGYNNSNGTSTQANAIAYWNQAASAITNDTYPKLKAYVAFDTSTNGTSQVGLDFSGAVSTSEQAAYNSFANAIFAKASAPDPTPEPEPSDTVKPLISITAPSDGQTVSGTITIGVDASDNVGITKVETFWDGTHIIRSATAQNAYGWGSRWSSSNAPDGQHTITAVAYDAAGNTATAQLTITVSNAEAGTGSVTPDPVVETPDGQQVVNGQAASSVDSGQLITLDPELVSNPEKTAQVDKVEFYIGAELFQTVSEPPFVFDTSTLAPGTYRLTQRTYLKDGTTTETAQDITIEGTPTAQSAVTNKVVGVESDGMPRLLWLAIPGALLVLSTIALFMRRKSFGALIRRPARIAPRVAEDPDLRPLNGITTVAPGDLIEPKKDNHK